MPSTHVNLVDVNHAHMYNTSIVCSSMNNNKQVIESLQAASSIVDQGH